MVVQVPLDDAQRLAGLNAKLAQRGVPATVSDMAAHDRFVLEHKDHRLKP
ncbi:MAG TPA: hypothetical protein VM264_06030 [Acidimicrobiales bacterium]|nr:hypothetical protein [Acidimicrobiales bacterium]